MYLAEYDLAAAKPSFDPDVPADQRSFWEWAPILPVQNPRFRAGLGEGRTPLVLSRHLAESIGLSELWFKDEGCNPGGSFKARGMAAAVARAAELGAPALALPSAGNAGAAAAAYGAFWGLPVTVAFPEVTPRTFVDQASGFGAECCVVEGSIADAGVWLTQRQELSHAFFLNTLKEPYRVEGKKIMGYELVAQNKGVWPDVVVYPTGGGTGLIGMIKAHREMTELGMVSGPPPRWVVVQMEGCAPLVKAFAEGRSHAEPWKDPQTQAFGLRVPGSIGDHYILDGLREHGGTAVSVNETDLRASQKELAQMEGILAAPEAAAAWQACKILREQGWLNDKDRTAVFLTGNGFQYPAEAR